MQDLIKSIADKSADDCHNTIFKYTYISVILAIIIYEIIFKIWINYRKSKSLLNGIFFPAKDDDSLEPDQNSKNCNLFSCLFQHKFKFNTLSSILHLIYIVASNDNNFSIGKRRSFLLVAINLVSITIKSFYMVLNREDKGNLYSTFFCSPITAFLEFFWLDRADSYMFHLGACVSILDFFITVMVDVPYIIKSSTENTRQERTQQYREHLDSEKAVQDGKPIFSRVLLNVSGKRLTNSKINRKVDNDVKNDPMSNCSKAMLFIIMLSVPIFLHFVRFLHFFLGPDDIFEKVGGCKFGFISFWKPEKYWSSVISTLTVFHYTFGLLIFWKIVKIKRDYVNNQLEI